MRYIGSTVYNYSTTSSTEVSCPIPIGETLTSISVYLSNSQKTLLTGRVSCSLRSTNGTHNDHAPDYLIDYAYSSTKTTSAGPGTKVLGWCGSEITAKKFNTLVCVLPKMTSSADMAGIGGISYTESGCIVVD